VRAPNAAPQHAAPRRTPLLVSRLTRRAAQTPRYEVLAERGRFEVREYEEFCVASTPMGSGFSAFDSLAGYIFGKNQEEVKMAMTTPVISSPDGQKMSFIMPSKFWADTGGAPTPLAAANVTLERAGGGLLQSANTQAVMWFGGYTTKVRGAEPARRAPRAWPSEALLARGGRTKLRAVGRHCARPSRRTRNGRSAPTLPRTAASCGALVSCARRGSAPAVCGPTRRGGPRPSTVRMSPS